MTHLLGILVAQKHPARSPCRHVSAPADFTGARKPVGSTTSALGLETTTPEKRVPSLLLYQALGWCQGQRFRRLGTQLCNKKRLSLSLKLPSSRLPAFGLRVSFDLSSPCMTATFRRGTGTETLRAAFGTEGE